MSEPIHTLPPISSLGFGKVFCPKHIVSKYKNGKWSEPELIDSIEFKLSLAAKVFHYSQEVFEGLKAYKSPNSGKVQIFRPDANVARMEKSCEALALPVFPNNIFQSSLKKLVLINKEWVPDDPGSLYLRPTMIGTSPTLGIGASEECLFFILASPVQGYFGNVKTDKPYGVRLIVEQSAIRAAPGGVGFAKTGGNYAASLKALSTARNAGYNDVIFLDAIEKKYIEELSGMNFMIVEDGVLKTPPLSDTILAGVTRDSILGIAKSKGIKVSEEKLDVFSVCKGIEEGSVTEAFACGTAAAISSIKSIDLNDKRYDLYTENEPGDITCSLYKSLKNIQLNIELGEFKDWVVEV